MSFDVAIVGGGPAGLSAALILGRARKNVLLCDAGRPRNAAAERSHGFITRDGTPPSEIRQIARVQLVPYGVALREALVRNVRGERDRFHVDLGDEQLEARRVLLCGGMVDELPALPGFRELWGKTIVPCPHCHGWEVRERAVGCLATTPALLEWALLLRGWSHDVIAFTDGRFAVESALQARMEGRGVRIEPRKLARLLPRTDSAGTLEQLAAVELVDGTRVARDVLFARPVQRQTELVAELGLASDDQGYLKVDAKLQTSRPGIYAAGDLTTAQQSAIVASSAGALAAYAIHQELTLG